MGRVSYTGLNPQQPIQRQPNLGGGGGGQSISTATTGQQQPEEQGLLGQVVQGKLAYDGVKSAAQGGRNINHYFTKPGGLLEQGQDVATGVGNFLSNSYQPTNAAISEATSSIMPGSSGAGMGGAYQMPGGSVNALPQGMQELVTPGMQQSIEGLSGAGFLEAKAAAEAASVGGKTVGTGAEAAAKGAGSKALGVAGGLLGAGLSINDMVENGASVANVAGLTSGLAFAATPWLAAAGPVGYAALGIGVVASMFDW